MKSIGASLIMILIFSTSCFRPAKPTTKSTEALSESVKPVLEQSAADSNGASPPAGDPLLALHADQKACASCHEPKRPSPTHYSKVDCVSCHAYPSFKDRKAFAHSPKPAVCEDCHARPATTGLRAYPNQGPPVGFDPNNKAAPGSGHYVGKDCSVCHSTPAEGATAFVFTHATPKAEFCLPCHFNNAQGEHANDNDVILADFGNCYSCHQNFNRNENRNFDANDD